MSRGQQSESDDIHPHDLPARSTASGGSRIVPVGEDDQLPAPEPERFVFIPPIDIYETEEGLVLEADLPGVSADSLELQIQDNKLTFFGRVPKSEPDDAMIRHQEYAIGDFLRSFILSDEVDYDRISARLNNGVLRVVLPKASRALPRKIDVSIE